MSMSMILARETRTTSLPSPVVPARTRTSELAHWAGPALVIIALLLAVVVPVTLAMPTLTAPPSEQVVRIDRAPAGLGGAAGE
jgi:hypothetical protein